MWAVTNLEEMIRWIVEFGAFGVVAWLVYYTHKVSIPRSEASFKEALMQQRKDFQDELARTRTDLGLVLKDERREYREFTQHTLKELSELTNAVHKLSVILVYHDATVRDEGGKAGSMEEMMRILRGS
jgi:hypothetical protein